MGTALTTLYDMTRQVSKDAIQERRAEIAAHFRAIRARLGLSLEQLAEASGSNAGSISQIEHGGVWRQRDAERVARTLDELAERTPEERQKARKGE
jgi:DNA-binding XRE family transcriptional regulator